jgi:hypothetical protein
VVTTSIDYRASGGRQAESRGGEGLVVGGGRSQRGGGRVARGGGRAEPEG